MSLQDNDIRDTRYYWIPEHAESRTCHRSLCRFKVLSLAHLHDPQADLIHDLYIEPSSPVTLSIQGNPSNLTTKKIIEYRERQELGFNLW